MRVLVVGGTGFIGPFAIKTLLELGHTVTVFHRGEAKAALPESVGRIYGNRNDLHAYRRVFEQLAPDVVLDFILSDARQAQAFMDTFRGLTARVIAISSQDVYRAYGVLLGREPGPPQATPLTEESEVRTQLHPYDVEHLRAVQSAFPWLTDDYDKIPVERTILSDPSLPGTVLRLAMVYGPGDPLHRFFPTLKRIDDRRLAILLEESYARLHPPRGYVEDVAAAIALNRMHHRVGNAPIPRHRLIRNNSITRQRTPRSTPPKPCERTGLPWTLRPPPPQRASSSRHARRPPRRRRAGWSRA
jgi:nucleoside-diphosphate-sugar epimerase